MTYYMPGAGYSSPPKVATLFFEALGWVCSGLAPLNGRSPFAPINRPPPSSPSPFPNPPRLHLQLEGGMAQGRPPRRRHGQGQEVAPLLPGGQGGAQRARAGYPPPLPGEAPAADAPAHQSHHLPPPPPGPVRPLHGPHQARLRAGALRPRRRPPPQLPRAGEADQAEKRALDRHQALQAADDGQGRGGECR